MAVSERLLDPPAHWPSATELEQAAAGGALLLLPEQLKAERDTTTAFFRLEAHDLRARARDAGVDTVLLAPEGAERAGYSEFTADWVLPVVVAGAVAIPVQVVADVIHDRIAGSPSFDAGDVAIAHEVVEAHGELEVGLADASIVVLPRWYETVDILTLDERHFQTLRGATGRPFRILPADAPS